MRSGIYAEMRIERPPTCQVAAVSREVSPVGAVSRSVSASGTSVTEEFTASEDATVDADEVFRYDAESVYRLARERGQGCVCERIESHDCPVRDVRARDGALLVSFYAPDLESLREIIGDLRAAFDGVAVRRLTRSECPSDSGELVLVDRDALTDRQADVLETAHEMGYFSHPKGANAGEVADALGVNRATLAEHLAAAQTKLLDALLVE
ncbi:helix-turn-helix domain-containing protein [Halomarina pelagica]|uniref:helix-turn-helix domain-containing protein n=1 Tax=Halomarina pelagica TaxID=2961599 RepID=UPI0020C51A2B|nr:helix-turn-helix domain-containing protein [Halomarina sp. BND7]